MGSIKFLTRAHSKKGGSNGDDLLFNGVLNVGFNQQTVHLRVDILANKTNKRNESSRTSFTSIY